MRLSLLAAVLALSLPAVAGDKDAAPAAAPSQLDVIKSLAGDWKGMADMHGKKVETKTSFRVTSAGSAVVETMNAGTPMEMTNVYHMVDGKLVMTHYCAMGNAPELALKSGDAKSLSFEAVKANGIDPEKTPHMHSLVYSLADKDHLAATWTSANAGKEHEAPAVFSYARVQ